MKIYVEDRKKTKIKDKNYVANVLQGVSDKLLHTKGNINHVTDEIILAEIANCASMLQNVLDDMTYED